MKNSILLHLKLQNYHHKRTKPIFNKSKKIYRKSTGNSVVNQMSANDNNKFKEKDDEQPD